MKNNSFMKNVLLLVTLFACFFGKAQTGLWGAEVSRDRKHAEVSGLISKQYAAKELAGENLVPEAKMTPFAEAKGDVIYQEDFESVYGMSPYPLPAGWASLATPSHEEDKWLAGTLGSEGSPVFGNSGMRYAYILTSTETAHDAWAFTPALDLVADETYSISFWVRLHGAYNEHYEALEVMIGMDTAADAMETVLYEVDDAIYSWWQNVTVRYKAKESGEHYIGFHSLTPASELLYATFIDDIQVEHLPKLPQFEGAAALSMGEVFTNVELPVSTQYAITNRGIADLEVDLVSASDEISVEGLPLVIPSDSTRNITLSLALAQNGAYTGNFVLSTNDTANGNVEVTVTATGVEARITSYNEEGFEGGALPEDWSANGFTLQAGSGVGGSYSLRANPWGQWAYDFATHIVQMGAEPVVEFKYKALDWGNAAVADSVVVFSVLVSDDYGLSYDTVYAVGPEETQQHTASADYALVHLDLPDYAMKSCKIKVWVSCTNTAGYWFYVDDMAIGTPPENDLAVAGFSAEKLVHAGQTTSCLLDLRNVGTQSQSDYTVELYAEDGTVLYSLPGTIIAGREEKSFELPWTPDSEGRQVLFARVAMDGDEDTLNNVSDAFAVEVLPASMGMLSIGSKTEVATSYYTPMLFTAANSASQTLYYPHELASNGGEIAGLVWETKFSTPHAGIPVKIWIGETDSANLKDAFVDPEALTKVFDGTLDFGIQDQEQVPVVFDAPYRYQGGNLVVYVWKSDPAYVYAYGDQFYATMDPNSNRSRVIYTYDASSVIDTLHPGSVAGNQFVEHLYPNVTFLRSVDSLAVLTGKVTDKEGNPLAGAEVRLAGTSLYQISDSTGRYSFYLTPGTYDMEAQLYGYIPFAVSGKVLTSAGEFVQDIVLQARPYCSLQGKVTDAGTGLPLAGARIRLDGISSYSAQSGDDGTYVLDSLLGGFDAKYALQVKAFGYETVSDSLLLQADTVMDVPLFESAYPVREALAVLNQDSTCAMISWTKPGAVSATFVLDDSTAEDGMRAGANFGDAYGNLFPVEGNGVLTSIDLYGVSDAYATEGRTVSLEIRDAEKALIAVSEPFELPADAWITVELDDVPYEGDFYVMVRWSATEGNTNYLGLDNNGPELASGFGWYETSGNWAVWPGVFMIRAHALVYGDTKGVQGLVSDGRKAVEEYSVYRLNEGDAEADWTLLATVADTSYADEDFAVLPQGTYQYAVCAVYPGDRESEAVLTNVLRKGNVGNDVSEEWVVSVWPNPVSDELYIQSGIPVEGIVLYDMQGRKLMERYGNVAHINMGDLPQGIYLLQIYSDQGSGLRRIVKN